MVAKPAVGQRRYEVIEVLRFIAATAVVFVHIPGFGRGNFGVDIFFIISGFVMMLSTEVSADNFFRKRLIRVLPTYYLFTAGVFIVAILAPGLLNNTTANAVHLVKSLLFIPFDKNGSGHFPVLFLGWTLNYEMFFYAVFALALMATLRYRALVATGLLTVIFTACLGSRELPLAAYGDLIVFEFVIGMMLYELVVKKNVGHSLIMGGVVVFAIMTVNGAFDHRLVKAGLPSAVLVTSLLLVFGRNRFPRILLTLGGASYALYLTHPYVIQFFEKITGVFSGGATEAALALVSSLVLVNLVAVAIYRFVETPIRHHLRAKLL